MALSFETREGPRQTLGWRARARRGWGPTTGQAVSCRHHRRAGRLALLRHADRFL